MIDILFPSSSSAAGQIVLAAVQRSVSSTQARAISRSGLNASPSSIVVAVDAPDAWGDALLEWLRVGSRKLLVFGKMPAALMAYLACRHSTWPEALTSASRSSPAASRGTSRSRAAVQYTALAARLGGSAWMRPFERFDFTDEWNNLGFGAIRGDDSIWAARYAVDVPECARLASVSIDDERCFSYAALWEQEATSVLWFNRAVGPCDSFEWRLVENFIATHRAEELHCQPILSEIPWGHDALITSRLDCDENVESARPLWETYRRLGIPFSLAVHTSNLSHSGNHGILRELVCANEAVLSHTATHAPNWGGCYNAALVEGEESARLIEAVTGKRVRYAVSPFHQSPPYALQALADTGYMGCIGGIIRNDPEFVLARGGALMGMPTGFIGHSQQCMLHGDCMLAQGDALSIFKHAFDLAFETKTLFGYLDHPFSERYQYGWPTEAARIEAHEQLISYMTTRASKPLFVNEEVALDFLFFKSLSCVTEQDGTFVVHLPHDLPADLPLAVEFRGECLEVVPGRRLQ